MYNFLTKNGTALAFGLGILGVLIFYGSIAGGYGDFAAIAEEEQAASPEGDIFLPGMYFTAFLIAVAFAAAVLFGIYQVATNPKGALKGIIGVVALAVIFGILYTTASEAIDPKYNTADFNFADGGVSKYVGGALKTTIALAGLAFVGLLVSEIRNFFK